MGSDESHLNVSLGSNGRSYKTVSTYHNLFEEKGEPKRYRTKVIPLTSLTARPNRLTVESSLLTDTVYLCMCVHKHPRKRNPVRVHLHVRISFYV